MLLIHNAFFLSATYAQGAKPVGRIFLTFSQREMPFHAPIHWSFTP